MYLKLSQHCSSTVVVVSLLSPVQLFCDPKDCARLPVSLGFLSQEYWSG